MSFQPGPDSNVHVISMKYITCRSEFRVPGELNEIFKGT